MRVLSAEEIKKLEHSLGQAVAWCEFKTKQTNRKKWISPFDVDTPSCPDYFWTSELNPGEIGHVPAAVEAVQLKRLNLMTINKIEPNSSSPEWRLMGRLLRCRFQDSLFDTAPEYLSSGFFNKEDLPPWDTWVTSITESRPDRVDRIEIIAWVPALWMPVADAGVDASPTATNLWAACINDELTIQLRETRFL